MHIQKCTSSCECWSLQLWWSSVVHFDFSHRNLHFMKTHSTKNSNSETFLSNRVWLYKELNTLQCEAKICFNIKHFYFIIFPFHYTDFCYKEHSLDVTTQSLLAAAYTFIHITCCRCSSHSQRNIERQSITEVGSRVTWIVCKLHVVSTVCVYTKLYFFFLTTHRTCSSC